MTQKGNDLRMTLTFDIHFSPDQVQDKYGLKKIHNLHCVHTNRQTGENQLQYAQYSIPKIGNFMNQITITGNYYR